MVTHERQREVAAVRVPVDVPFVDAEDAPQVGEVGRVLGRVIGAEIDAGLDEPVVACACGGRLPAAREG
jgi:hypothetical protein